jgi:Transposase zinc-binding domain
VADVFRRYGDTYRQRHDLPRVQRRVMTAIERCRTAALGGHVDQCDQCGHQRISSVLCSSRHQIRANDGIASSSLAAFG